MGTEYIAVAFTILFTIATSLLLGRYMFHVFTGGRTLLDPVLVPIERLVLRLTGVDPNEQQDWKQVLAVAADLERLHVAGDVDDRDAAAVPAAQPGRHRATWSRRSRSTRSRASPRTRTCSITAARPGSRTSRRCSSITFLQFVTAATGVAACIAIIRGLAGNRLTHLGNFYVDLTRATVRVFLPLAVLVSVIVMSQGTPMTFEGAAKATTVEGQEQTIARGVTAGVVSIKQLGTNGGGYFGPNSAHPYENPTPLSNFVETWSIAIIPMAMVWTLGYIVGRRQLAVVIFVTMLAIYIPMVVFGVAIEAGGNPAISAMGVDQTTGSMEGKEVRFGSGLSALWAVTTTVTSNGSVNAMHDSLTPLGGLMPLIGMWLNNIFGGVGVGFINMLIFVIVAVFVAGMMIGRTPEFLGKKVEAKEMKLASLALLWHPLAILVGTAIACYVWATTADPGQRSPG